MRPSVRAAYVAVAGVLVLAGSGCAAGESADRSAATTSVSNSAASRLVGPDEFARRVDDPRVVTINVHVPDEGKIAGTDLVIPFDKISTSSELPADRATPLAVYCRSGNMSAQAVKALKALGYTDVVELSGGFNAWTKAGKPLEPSTT